MVNGWAGGGSEELEDVLSRRLQELPPPVVRGTSASPPASTREMELRVPQEELDLLAKVGAAVVAVAVVWWGIVCGRQLSVCEGCQLLAQRAGRRYGWLLQLGSGAAYVYLSALPDPLPAALQQASTSASDNDWELDPNEIIFHEKIASGAFGDLFRGSYCGQDVAIKILRNVHEDSQQFQEFLQEVAIMRKVCCRLGKGADVARVAAGSRRYEGGSSSGGSVADAREWSQVVGKTVVPAAEW